MKASSFYGTALTIFSTLILSACTPTRFSQAPQVGSNGDLAAANAPVQSSEVTQNCLKGSKQKLSFSYNFPKPNKTCVWNSDGNLSPRNEYFQARIEQTKNLALAPNSIICDIKFKFDPQQFLYDDHFIFTFNNAIIASSYNFNSVLTEKYGLQRYDWLKLAGIFWDSTKEGIYCPSGSQCSWPTTDTAGTISLNYPASVFQTLMAENINRSNHQITFISIGDNDQDDCDHSDINFSLEVEFVSK